MNLFSFTLKSLSTLGALLLFTTYCFSQESIRGLIHDKEGKSLSYANVLLLQAKDSTLVKGMVCNESGSYKLERLSPGQYLLMASMMGYKKFYSTGFTLKEARGELVINTIQLEEDVQQLGTVVVEAQKQLYEQQLDKLVVNVQSSITSAGGSALEVLERSPGITLNRQSNQLSMAGKQGVVVMINGKPSRMPIEAVLQMLSGMNASNIEKIELITTPPASFDAEGNAGIINIVLKKDSEWGTNGSFTLSMGYGWYEKPAASVNVNHRTPRLSLYGDYSFSLNHAMQQFDLYRTQGSQQDLSSLSTKSVRNTRLYMHNARMGADYKLGVKTTIGGLLAGFDSKWVMDARNNTKIHQPQQQTASIQMLNHEVNHWQHWMANLNLRHIFSEQKQFSVDMDYLYYHDNNPHTYVNSFENVAENSVADEIRISKLTPIRVGVIKADYSYQASENTKWEVGLKGTLSQLGNDVVVRNLSQGKWQRDQELSQSVDMEENIGAAYVSYQQNFGSKISLQSGLRWEYTYTHLSSPEDANLVHREYGKLFPSLFLSKGIGEHNKVQFSYSRRITRPTYNDLAPFVVFFDPYTFFAGNTNLKPAITDAFQAGYQFKGGYMISLNYSLEEDAIARFQTRLDPETNKQYGYTENIDNINTFSLNLSLPLDVTTWWHIQSNLMGVNQNLRTLYLGVPVELSNQYAAVNATLSFKLPADFSTELSGFYRSSSLFGIAKLHAVGALNAGVQKKFANNKGTLKLAVNDIFWTARFKFTTENPELHLNGYGRFFTEPRVVQLSYTRNFGNKNVKSSKRDTGSEEERRRVGN